MAYDQATTYETIELFGLTEKDAHLPIPQDDILKDSIIREAFETLLGQLRGTGLEGEIEPLAHGLATILQRRKVALGEVHNVDVVAHARAVGGVVVAAKDGQRLPPPDRDLRHVRHQIVRRAAGVLADAAGGVRADGVEVPKGDDAPLLSGGRLRAAGFIG